MRIRKPMPIRSKTRPIATKTQTTYDKYIAVQTALGLPIKEAYRKWKELCRASEMAAMQGQIIKPINW
jgi:hypothetical protein